MFFPERMFVMRLILTFRRIVSWHVYPSKEGELPAVRIVSVICFLTSAIILIIIFFTRKNTIKEITNRMIIVIPITYKPIIHGIDTCITIFQTLQTFTQITISCMRFQQLSQYLRKPDVWRLKGVPELLLQMWITKRLNFYFYH